MQLVCCGGASEVGASCFLLQIDGKNILLDSGIRMKQGGDLLPSFRRIQELGGVDVILVSHAHLDHTGSLPVISREYPHARIYMTHATKALTQVLLYDSLKIMDHNEADIPLYAQKNVEEMLNQIVCYSPQFTFSPFADHDLKVTFYSAGHVLGAVMIYIQGQEGTLLYTGDFSVIAQQTVNGTQVPKLRPDILIMESTYGQYLHANRQTEEARLVATVGEVILGDGKVLIPAFALGRAQEVILILKKAMVKKQIPEFRIYVDGMVRAINLVYQSMPNYLKPQLAKKIFRSHRIFYDEHVIAIDKPEQRKEILESKEPLCIISSSGMLKGGPSALYAAGLASDEKNFIAITGYQDEEAPGRELLNLLDLTDTDRSIVLDGAAIPLKCGFGSYSLSAHADRGELLGLAHRVSPRKLFLVHGDPNSITPLAQQIQGDIRGQVYIPENGDEYAFYLRNPRKQLDLNMTIHPLGRDLDELTNDSIEVLWDAVYQATGIQRGYTVEELIFWWSGNNSPNDEQVTLVMQLINESSYFKPNNRKLFLFHPVDINELESQDNVMELNVMLAWVKELFPSEAGLYKAGARVEQQTVLLNFNFPQKVSVEYADLIDQIEPTTGWKVEVNKECNGQAAEALIYSLLPAGSTVNKISYFRQQNCFQVNLEEEPNNTTQIANSFFAATGMELRLGSTCEQSFPIGSLMFSPDSTSIPLEQNQAFAYIDEVLNKAQVGWYKKGRKQHGTQLYIELSFISSHLADRYRDMLASIAEDTGWHIVINRNPNQNEIIRIVKQLCAKRNIGLKRNPGIYADKNVVEIDILAPVDDISLQDVTEEVYAATGFELRFT